MARKTVHRVVRRSPALVGDFNTGERPVGIPATRRHGELRIVGLTKPIADMRWIVFQVGDGKRVELPITELSPAVGRIFDASTRNVGGEVLNGTDVMDLYQWVMQTLFGERRAVCFHHLDAPLGADESCPACITEQTEGDA